MANTANGFPYPLGTDKVMDGDNVIQALAQKCDDELYGGTRSKIRVLRPTVTTGTVLDFPSVSSGGRQTLTITVPGAVLGDFVVWNINPQGLTNGLVHTVGVSAANTVMVMIHNITGAAIDPVALTYFVAVLQF